MWQHLLPSHFWSGYPHSFCIMIKFCSQHLELRNEEPRKNQFAESVCYMFLLEMNKQLRGQKTLTTMTSGFWWRCSHAKPGFPQMLICSIKCPVFDFLRYMDGQPIVIEKKRVMGYITSPVNCSEHEPAKKFAARSWLRPSPHTIPLAPMKLVAGIPESGTPITS